MNAGGLPATGRQPVLPHQFPEGATVLASGPRGPGDVPVVGADPEDSVQAATFRGRKGDTVSIGSGQAISHEEAAACFSCEKRALDDR